VAVTPPSQFDQVGFGVAAFVELLKNVVEIAAIGTGGFWTYFNFFKGRTYKPRLECRVDGSVETHSGRSLMKVVVRVKNVGLSKVSIEQKGTILQLYPAVSQSSSPSSPCQMIWSEKPAVFDVFKDQECVEPSEPIEDQVLVELPNDEAPAYKLALRVLSKKTWWTAGNIVGTSEEHRMNGGNREQSPRSHAGGSE